MNDDGKLLDPLQRGEIVVRSALVMAGYYQNAEATADAGRHGWHHTGDIGYLDHDGYLFIVDRAKDMIISGGFNVYSAEVEQAIMGFPGIRDCAVVGLPDEKWGEQVTAVIQCDDPAAVDPEAVRQFVRGRIGGVKTPKRIDIWPDLPRSKVGKVLKSEIKATCSTPPTFPELCNRTFPSSPTRLFPELRNETFPELVEGPESQYRRRAFLG